MKVLRQEIFSLSSHSAFEKERLIGFDFRLIEVLMIFCKLLT